MTEYIYEYDRGWDGTRYHVENIERVDGEGNHIELANEIKTSLPNKTFRIFCAKNTLQCVFYVELSGAEQTTLSTTITNHKNNT